MPQLKSLCTTLDWTLALGVLRSEGPGTGTPWTSASVPAWVQDHDPHGTSIPPPAGNEFQSQDRGARSCAALSPRRAEVTETSAGGPRLVSAIPSIPPRGNDTGTALPPWKLLSEMLLSLCTVRPT